MEESDFSIRNEVESINIGNPELQELISRYRHPELSSTPAPEKISLSETGSLKNAILALLSKKEKRDDNFSGLQLSVGSNVLQWIVLLLFVILVIWLILKYTQSTKTPTQSKKKRNPIRRVRVLEKKVKKLERELDNDEMDQSDISESEPDFGGIPF